MTQSTPQAARRFFWMGASLVAGVILAAFAIGKGLFNNPDTRVFELSVFFGAWLAIVLLLRVFSRRFRSIDDMTIEGLVKREGNDPPKR